MMTSNFPHNEDDGDDDNDSKSHNLNHNHNHDDDDNHESPFHRDSSVTTVPHKDQDEG